jgi:hypothetical protein
MGVTIQGIYVRLVELISITSTIDGLETGWWMSFRLESESTVIRMAAHLLILAGSLYFGYSSVRRGARDISV